MKAKPFLQQVAETYLTNEPGRLADLSFVFPNKRSATFFQWYLSKAASDVIIPPETITISDFIGRLTPLEEANRYQQIFTLYNVYRSLPEMQGEEVDFEQFLFWGEMLISDFNDVDRYIVDPTKLFSNLRSLRQIGTDFFTREQKEVLRDYFGQPFAEEENEHLWLHLDYSEKHADTRKSFVKLWEVMLPLYTGYNEKLAERGLIGNGRMYRNAADTLDRISLDTLPARRYIFVGFNVLSTSELKIFELMKPKADYYWDFNSPALRLSPNRAGRFILKNIERFPSRYPLEEEKITTLPKIDIIGVPSNVGMAKIASGVIDKLAREKHLNPSNAVNTAVVLPNEGMLIPVIESLGPDINPLNITMGFPLRLSPLASLQRNIVSLQLRAGRRKGEPSFYYEDVKPLLLSPLINSADPDGCARLCEEITGRHLFQITPSTITEAVPALSRVFVSLGPEATFSDMSVYLNGLCDFLLEHIDPSDSMGRYYIEGYRQAIGELCRAADEFGIDMSGRSLFRLVERAVRGSSVNFRGEPLAGLQVMGVLETRALDFENIVMLSMNERVFPRKQYTRSFIPDQLRRGFGMATLDFQESIFAYYFYRLISRPERVTLIYDARRSGGMRSSEMSRYLTQLLYMFPDAGIRHLLGLYKPSKGQEQEISISKKSERVRTGLARFLAPRPGESKSDRRFLSASALNCYIDCPLQFYLRFVEGYDPMDDEMVDYMDYSALGTILHEVMQQYYQRYQPYTEGPDPHNPGTMKKEWKPYEVTSDMLKRTLDSPSHEGLDRLITRTINKVYNRYEGDKLDRPLAGETLIQARVFRETVLEILRNDLTLTLIAPLKFVDAEKGMPAEIKINDDITVNVYQIIDRIDEVFDEGRYTMRFVDYKTGGDELKASGVEAMFDGSLAHRPKAIMQLMMYCHVYRCATGDDRPIQPVIYKTREIMMTGGSTSKLFVNKQPITDYHQVYTEFQSVFNSKVAEIFDENIDFTQATSDGACKFCKFKPICGRDK